MCLFGAKFKELESCNQETKIWHFYNQFIILVFFDKKVLGALFIVSTQLSTFSRTLRYYSYFF